MWMGVLKYASQALLLVGGIMSLWWDTHIIPPGGRKRPTFLGWITIAAFIIGFALFALTDITERKEKAEKEAAQKQEINYLKQLYFNQNLAEVEISFKPSAEHWARIAEAYKSTERINMPVSYMDANMVAERVVGGGYWKIKFEPIDRTEASVRFTPVSTNEPNGKGFENVIREAMIGLWIKWGDSVKTELQPKTGEDYPLVIAVSKDKIAYTLRPPLITLRLSSLSQNSTVILRAEENYPSSITFHSLDPLAEFDETFTLSWTKKEDGSFEAKILPYISAPHRLSVKFKTDPA